MPIDRVNVERLARLPSFSHATVAGGFTYVSGTLGTLDGTTELKAGGAAAETNQVVNNHHSILETARATTKDVVKLNIYLSEMETFEQMDNAFVEAWSGPPPARITVGRAGLALGASVDMDCIAYIDN